MQIEELASRLRQRDREILRLEGDCQNLRGGQQGKIVPERDIQCSLPWFYLIPAVSVRCNGSLLQLSGQRLEAQHLSDELRAANEQLRGQSLNEWQFLSHQSISPLHVPTRHHLTILRKYITGDHIGGDGVGQGMSELNPG